MVNNKEKELYLKMLKNYHYNDMIKVYHCNDSLEVQHE